MTKDVSDYEKSEKIAINAGKKALERAEWLHFRSVPKTKGFFVELRENDVVHPQHYSVHCVDGNGTKLFLSAWSGDYRFGPTDAIAMNANDMATVIHAFADVLNLYLACQTWVEENQMGSIMNGFVDALERIRIDGAPFQINIGKLETASLDEMISLGVPGRGVDFGVVMSGYIRKDQVPNLNPMPGHWIVGVGSTGLHSNGFTGARHVLLRPNPDLEARDEWRKGYKGQFDLDDKPWVLKGKTVLEALQAPTALYMTEAGKVGMTFDNRDIYGVNITGNGLHNFNRAGKAVTFMITDPLPPLPIHELLIQESGWTPEQAYTKQNMGMGFAYICPTQNIAESIVGLINRAGEHRAKIVGRVGPSFDDKLTTIIEKPYEGGQLRFIGYNA